MGIDKSVKEAQNHNAILKASQEHTEDQVVKQEVPLWHHGDVPPEGKKKVVQSGTFIAVREGVRCIRTSNTAGVIMFFSVKSLCSAQPITEDAEEANKQSRAGSTRDSFQMWQNFRNAMATDWSQDSCDTTERLSKVLCT